MMLRSFAVIERQFLDLDRTRTAGLLRSTAKHPTPTAYGRKRGGAPVSAHYSHCALSREINAFATLRIVANMRQVRW
jgi:hypothetical protein